MGSLGSQFPSFPQLGEPSALQATEASNSTSRVTSAGTKHSMTTANSTSTVSIMDGLGCCRYHRVIFTSRHKRGTKFTKIGFHLDAVRKRHISSGMLDRIFRIHVYPAPTASDQSLILEHYRKRWVLLMTGRVNNDQVDLAVMPPPHIMIPCRVQNQKLCRLLCSRSFPKHTGSKEYLTETFDILPCRYNPLESFTGNPSIIW